MQKIVFLAALLMSATSAFADGAGGCDPLDPGCVSALPEPETMALIAVGAVAMLAARRKK